jgi:hypothetical protein
MLNATSYIPFKNGSTSLILTLSSMAHSGLCLSVARKQEIVSLKQVRTFWSHIWTCSITHFRVLMSPLIPFMLTGARTCSFMMLPYLVNWFLRHLMLLTHQVRSTLPDKRPRRWEQSIPFFSFLHHYWGASSEVWQAEVDYLSVHGTFWYILDISTPLLVPS